MTQCPTCAARKQNPLWVVNMGSLCYNEVEIKKPADVGNIAGHETQGLNLCLPHRITLNKVTVKDLW